MEFRGQKRDHPSYSSTQKPETGERIPKHSRILLPMDIWIANISVPLSALTKNGHPFIWEEKKQLAFNSIKGLLSSPALGLPNTIKSFHLYVVESKGLAIGVVNQHLECWNRLVSYLPKNLDPVAARCPACLYIVAAVAILVKDTDKLTKGKI